MSTPSKTDDSAPAQRTLVTAFYACDHTLFADDLREITNPNHMLHENNLRTIATEGRGASAGLAGKNASVLVFRHFLLITAKYVPQVSPDVLNRSFIYYLNKLTEENRLSSKDFTYFSSMKFRVTARLNYLAWMFTSGFSHIIYQIQPRVSSLRYDGHNGVAGALLGDGRELHADLSAFEAYITKAQGPKCKAQYAQATDSGVVEYTSGRTVVDPLAYFVVASAFTMQSIAREIRRAVGIGRMEIWKLLITNTEVNDYCRIANTEGFTKIGIKKLGRQLFDSAKSGTLVREDGWHAIVKTITMSSGARNEHILLVNNQIHEFSMATWDMVLSSWAKIHAKKGEPSP